MLKLYKILFICLSCCFVLNVVYAQNKPVVKKSRGKVIIEETTVAPVDYYDQEQESNYNKTINNKLAKQKFELRKFDESKISAWKKDPRFQYNEESLAWQMDESRGSSSTASSSNGGYPNSYAPQRTYPTGSGTAAPQSTTTTQPTTSGGSTTPPPPPKAKTPELETTKVDLSWLYWVLGAIALAVIGYVIFNALNKPKYNKKINTGNINQQVNDDIHNIKYPTELEKAIANKNYRLAVKLMYLEQLKMLDDKNMINWSLSKTNWDFLSEIKDPVIQQNYKSSSFIFDSAWYGELPLSDNNFTQVYNMFMDYKKQLS